VRIPIEKLASDPRIGDKLGWIACSASSGDSGNRMARDFSTGVKLPAAHQLTAIDAGLKRRKYWQLVAPERVFYRREEERVEGFPRTAGAHARSNCSSGCTCCFGSRRNWKPHDPAFAKPGSLASGFYTAPLTGRCSSCLLRRWHVAVRIGPRGHR
jgi:hypothetical protein